MRMSRSFRPTNVDDPGRLRDILEALAETSPALPVVFPVHPRTAAALTRTGRPPRKGTVHHNQTGEEEIR